MFLRQSTAQTVKFGPGLDKTDGVSLETGLATAMDHATTGIRVSKDGGNYGDRNSSTAPTYDEMGDYDVELDATDTNTCGILRMIYEDSATCLPIWKEFYVVEEAIYDALFAASATGLLPANVTQLGGVAQSLTDLKDFADAGYDPATNKVQGVVLTDALTTNNDKTGYSISGTKTTLDALNDIAATSIVSGGAINTTAGAVDNVTTVATTTTNTDMRGTDGANTTTPPTVAQIVAGFMPPKNSAFSNIPFIMEDSDGNRLTGLTVTGERMIDGAAWAAVTGVIAEVGNGAYQFDASAADMNGDLIMFRMSEATAEDTFISVKTTG